MLAPAGFLLASKAAKAPLAEAQAGGLASRRHFYAIKK